jgi:hypothetical protein
MARAQQAAMPVIGFVNQGAAAGSPWRGRWCAFGLRADAVSQGNG